MVYGKHISGKNPNKYILKKMYTQKLCQNFFTLVLEPIFLCQAEQVLFFSGVLYAKFQPVGS